MWNRHKIVWTQANHFNFIKKSTFKSFALKRKKTKTYTISKNADFSNLAKISILAKS